jgi:hypothetical protein
MLTIDNAKYVNTAYFSTLVALPAVSLSPVQTNYRNQSAWTPGDHIQYEPLTVTFMVDEDMVNYREMLGWITANATRPGDPLCHDLTLSILTGKNNPNNRIRFMDAFPVSLSGFEFSTQATEVSFISATVTLQYSFFEFLAV